jgi:ABC-type Fe3+/spermidine/putrescine transport system ATPase subunit
MRQNILTLDKITKYFGVNKAVDDLTIHIKKGEIFTLLGPSGCGKTTTLRQVAGLEHPDEGEILLEDKVLCSPAQKINIPTHKRKMGMVFQSYAIWPHLTVFDTVAYPLRAQKVPKSEIRERVLKILELVGLKGYEDRPGPALSGGQQQRVAVARALVYEPEILLLDEPFSNLDVKLREQMRIELKILQRKIGITVILVTHDQLEALSLSDRIAVINQGKVEQIGTPHELYEQPISPFVRDFIGTSVKLQSLFKEIKEDGTVIIELKNSIKAEKEQNQRLSVNKNYLSSPVIDQEVTITIRPEDIIINSEQYRGNENELEGIIDTLLFVGDRYECRVEIGEKTVMVYAPRSQRLNEGQKIRLYLPPEVVSIWDK